MYLKTIYARLEQRQLGWLTIQPAGITRTVGTAGIQVTICLYVKPIAHPYCIINTIFQSELDIADKANVNYLLLYGYSAVTRTTSQCMPLRMACAVPNCELCAEDVQVCTECAEGYTLLANACVYKCKQGETYDVGTDSCNCSGGPACAKNEYCIAGGEGCRACAVGCASCEVENTCLQCDYGYRLDGDVCTASCKPNEQLDNNTCKCGESGRCQKGQFCEGAVPMACAVCRDRMANCEDCTDADTCILVAEQCADPNCSMCATDASVCQLCNEGFDLLNKQCINNTCTATNCITCADKEVCEQCAVGFELNAELKCVQTCGELTCVDTAICIQGKCYDCNNQERNVSGLCTCGQDTCELTMYCSEQNACQSCFQTMGNCSECTSSTICAKQELACVDVNCASCLNNANSCNECSQGYEEQLSQCFQTSCTLNNCKQCSADGTVCDLCAFEYSVDARGVCVRVCGDATCLPTQLCNNAQCYDCNENMVNINNHCMCGSVQCNAGQYCSNTLECSACQEIMPNCSECVSSTICSKYVTDCVDGNCQKCNASASNCEQCHEGFTASQGKCEQTCGSTSCKSNQVCTAEECIDCPNNEVNVGGTCKCGKLNSCASGWTCSEDKCEQCSALIERCSECFSEQVCTKCEEGYQVLENKCVSESCQVYNCKECSEAAICSVCNEGYAKDGAMCVQQCNQVNCQTDQICSDQMECVPCNKNEVNLDKKCTCTGTESCSDSHFCSNKQCVLCQEAMANCAMCSDETTCTKPIAACLDKNCSMCQTSEDACGTCAKGFEPKEGKCVQTCGEKACSTSEVCTANACVGCKGNELNIGGACKCGDEASCEGTTFCSGQKCEQCPSGCAECALADVCQKCKSGYTLKSGKCSKDASNTGMIIGIVVGVVVLVALIAGLIVFFKKQARSKNVVVHRSIPIVQPSLEQDAGNQLFI